MPGRVEGKVAFITGAARGQGRSHAVRLAQEGADIIALDICAQIDTVPIPMSTPEDLAETVELVKATGQRIHAVQADTRDYDAVKSAVDAGVEQFGRLDFIVANAGLAAGAAAIQDMEAEYWRDSVDVNLTGTFHTVKAAIPHLLNNGDDGGAIVLTSSVGGLKAHPYVGNYIASKHGVIGLMRSLAVELGCERIRVNAVCPTQVSTPMLMNDMTFRMFRPDLENPTAADMAPISENMHVFPEPWIDAIDVSNAVLFLLSDEGRYITGVALPIDLGNMLR